MAPVVSLKEEELQLRPDVEGIKAHVPAALEHPAEHPGGRPQRGFRQGYTRRRSAGPPLALGGPPGKMAKLFRVEVLIGLIDAGVALDGGAVKVIWLFTAFQFGRR